MKNKIIKDWIAFCEGQRDFDKSHFHTLFMKMEHEKQITEKEYDKIFRYFSNSDELIARIKNYHDSTYHKESNDIKSYLIEKVNSDIKEKRKILSETDSGVLQYIDNEIHYLENEDLLNLKMKNWQHEEFIDEIESNLINDEFFIDKKLIALFEAYYGLTRNFQLVWYLGAPLLNSPINLDYYYDIWKIGGDYVVTENGVIVSRNKG